MDDSTGDSNSDVEMGSSPLGKRARRRSRKVARRSAWPADCASVVLFPVVPMLPTAMSCPVREGMVPDTLDGDDSDFDDELGDNGYVPNDPACGGGSKAGRWEYSCGEELGHLNGKV